MTIPKILHFTWKSRELPKFFADILAQWRESHADWDIRFYDDADIRAVVADYPEHLAQFDAYRSGIFRSDAFRYFVLHRDGGVYADLDVVPLQRIDGMLEGVQCFAAVGPEPDSQVSDQLYGGMPYSLCNAFMGGVPGHPFWRYCIDRLALAADEDVVDATGPRFLHAAGLTIDRAQRPSAVLPDAWSPLSGTGQPAPMSAAFAARVSEQFDIVPNGRGAVVSHLWRNSWSMPIAYKGVQFWRWPNRLQWAFRRWRNPELAQITIAGPTVEYDEQAPRPVEPLPRVSIGLVAAEGSSGPGIAAALDALDYPRELMRIAIAGPAAGEIGAVLSDPEVLDGAEAPHTALLAWGAERAPYTLLLDARISSLPSNAVRALLATGRPVAGALCDWPEALAESFLYYGPVFKYMYRNGGRIGLVDGASAGREKHGVGRYRTLNFAPMTSVSLDCALVASEVVHAGILPDLVYKAHGGSTGFCIRARDLGFEVCAVPSVIARH